MISNRQNTCPDKSKITMDLESYARLVPMPAGIHADLKRWIDYWLSGREAGCTILDMGAGDGRVLSYLRSRYPGICSFGIEASRIRSERIVSQNLDCIFSTSPPLPIKTKSIDMIVSFEVIEHIRSDLLDDYLNEFCRILKPDGMLWVSTPNYPFKRYVDIRNYFLGHRKSWKDDPTHVHRFSWRSLEKTLERYFRSVEIRSSSRPHSDTQDNHADCLKVRFFVHKMHGFGIGPIGSQESEQEVVGR